MSDAAPTTYIDGRALKLLRLRSGQSQDGLASAAGLRKGTIGAIEGGAVSKHQTLGTLFALAAVLGCHPERLLDSPGEATKTAPPTAPPAAPEKAGDDVRALMAALLASHPQPVPKWALSEGQPGWTVDATTVAHARTVLHTVGTVLEEGDGWLRLRVPPPTPEIERTIARGRLGDRLLDTHLHVVDGAKAGRGQHLLQRSLLNPRNRDLLLAGILVVADDGRVVLGPDVGTSDGLEASLTTGRS